MSDDERIRALPALADAFRSLLAPPFRTLLLLSVLVSLATDSIAGPSATIEEGDLTLSIALFAVSLYVQIAVTLAAAAPDPEPSSDVWVKAAWRRRCLWRLILVNVVVVAALIAGLALLVIGVFFVGAVVALALPAAVLERKNPIDAVVRSAQLTKGARGAVGTIFGILFLVPTMAIWAGSLVDVPEALGPAWVAIPVAGTIWGLAGDIAFARLFVRLGGDYVPNPAKKGAEGENFR